MSLLITKEVFKIEKIENSLERGTRVVDGLQLAIAEEERQNRLKIS